MVGNSRVEISFDSTPISTWSLYEKFGSRAHVALKVNTISNSSANLSTIVFPDSDYCMFADLEWPNLHRINWLWYSFYDKLAPFSC